MIDFEARLDRGRPSARFRSARSVGGGEIVYGAWGQWSVCHPTNQKSPNPSPLSFHGLGKMGDQNYSVCYPRSALGHGGIAGKMKMLNEFIIDFSPFLKGYSFFRGSCKNK